MLVIYVVIPFFGYLWFIRLNESIAEKRFRVNDGMWRWKEYWWIEVGCMIFGTIILSLSFIFFIT